MCFKVIIKLALKHHKGIKMKILRNAHFKYLWNFFDGIDFLAGQHKAKNVIGGKFPKNEKLLMALKNISLFALGAVLKHVGTWPITLTLENKLALPLKLLPHSLRLKFTLSIGRPCWISKMNLNSKPIVQTQPRYIGASLVNYSSF